jgi:hypothetical protein
MQHVIERSEEITKTPLKYHYKSIFYEKISAREKPVSEMCPNFGPRERRGIDIARRPSATKPLAPEKILNGSLFPTGPRRSETNSEFEASTRGRFFSPSVRVRRRHAGVALG